MASIRPADHNLLIFVLILLCAGINCKPTNETKDSITSNTDPPKTQPHTQIITTSTDRIGTFFRSIIHQWIPSWIIDNLPASLSNYIRGRCIGAMKRIQHTFIPLFFKLGVMSTTLTVLTVMTLKGLLIGLLLLFFNITGFLSKLHAGKHYHDVGHYHPLIVPTPSWTAPHHPGSWGVQPIIKNIHVHVHPPSEHQQHHEEHFVDQYAGGYQRQDDLTKLLKAYREQTSTNHGLMNAWNSAGDNGGDGTNVNGLSLEDRKYIDKIISKLSS